MLADITPEYDSKLQQLVADLRYKFANPINDGNKKVIIFTAFSDTAEYLYDCLAERIKAKHGLHTALVSGDIEARSTLRLPQREKLDFNKVLTLFSPISKENLAHRYNLIYTHWVSKSMHWYARFNATTCLFVVAYIFAQLCMSR